MRGNQVHWSHWHMQISVPGLHFVSHLAKSHWSALFTCPLARRTRFTENGPPLVTCSLSLCASTSKLAVCHAKVKVTRVPPSISCYHSIVPSSSKLQAKLTTGYHKLTIFSLCTVYCFTRLPHATLHSWNCFLSLWECICLQLIRIDSLVKWSLSLLRGKGNMWTQVSLMLKFVLLFEDTHTRVRPVADHRCLPFCVFVTCILVQRTSKRERERES